MIRRMKSRRAAGYDYRNPGAYFITIKTYGKRDIFGTVHDGIVFLNQYGRIVLDEWKRIANVRDSVRVAECVVMPDHFHGILDILPYRQIEAGTTEFVLRAGSLGAIIGQFKSRVTKKIMVETGNTHFKVWQVNYHDHIIRSPADRQRISNYIRNNPMQFHP
jgi:REP element-mobilizing transposase RayT